MNDSGERMRIVMVGPHPEARGGISRVVRGWERAGLWERVQVTYITTLNDVTPGFRWNKILDALRAWFRVVQSVGRGVDLVHIHLSHGASFVRKFPIYLWCRWCGVPSVVHIHTGRLKKFYEKGPWLLRRGLRSMLQGCDAVMVLSGEWADYLKQQSITTPIDIVRNGTFLPPPDPDFRKENPERVDLLTMGRLGENKGSYLLVPVFAALAKSFPQAHLTMAGDGDTAKVRELVASLGMEGRITIPGWLEEEAGTRAYRGCDIYVLPSYFEGMPVSVVEAMSHGKPIVSTTVGGIGELVEEGRNGFLVNPGDAENLEKKLRRLLADSALRMRMGEESRIMMQERLDLYRLLDHIVGSYREILSKRKGS